MKNPRCWARKLDDCSDTKSGEHRISVAAWPDGSSRDEKLRKPITFLQGTLTSNGHLDTSVPGGFRREITLNTLTTNVLCTHHNSELTQTDVAAGQLSTAIRELMDTWKTKRWVNGLRYARKVFTVDGPAIERWFIKTAIANVAKLGHPIGGFDAEPGTPTDLLVDIAFDRAPVVGNIGLWGAGTLDEGIDESDNFGLMPWDWFDHANPSRRYIAGCLVFYRGFRFLVNLDTTIAPPIDQLRGQPGWQNTQLVRPFQGVNAPQPNLAIEFHWS